jgi:hypothetical protein
MPKVDYGVIEERSFEPVPEGIYEATLTDWELKQGGKGPYYNFEFTALDPELKNRKFWLMSSISDGALWKFKQHMLRWTPTTSFASVWVLRFVWSSRPNSTPQRTALKRSDPPSLRFSPHFPSN